MGALIGALFAGAVNALAPWLHADPQAYALIGMSSMAVAVVGGPLTMVFLALEMTGDFALRAVADRRRPGRRARPRGACSAISFATWRFHLRGEAIRSATTSAGSAT